MSQKKVIIVAKAFSFWFVFQCMLFALNMAYVNIPKWLVAIAFGSTLSLLMFFVTKLYLKTDTLTMASLGMTFVRGSVKRFSISLLLGAAFFGGFFLLYLGLSPVKIVVGSQSDLLLVILLAFLVMLALGTMEEIVFRGYFLRKLNTAMGLRASIYITSMAFGLYHGLAFDSITGPAVWGLLYGVLAFWSKGLAVPLGFHVGANFMQTIFGLKEKWTGGYWAFDMAEKSAPLTIEQITIGLQGFLLVIGVVLVEYYIRKVHKHQPFKA
jgi:membrane protease YdiL (CAAX protease family)